MNAYMTNGTLAFLLKLDEKHPQYHFFYMENQANVTVYYESEAKSLFVSGRGFEIIALKGTIQEDGYVVMNNIPVTEEGQPLFEERVKKSDQMMASPPGLYARRLLKPRKGQIYVVFTQWARKADYDNWKASSQFAAIHDNLNMKQSAYFANRPFTSHYHMVDFEDNQK